MDADGNAIAVSVHPSGVTYAARFARVLESWLLPTIIAGSAVASPRIALNAAGDGQAVWVQLPALCSAHRLATSDVTPV